MPSYQLRVRPVEEGMIPDLPSGSISVTIDVTANVQGGFTGTPFGCCDQVLRSIAHELKAGQNFICADCGHELEVIEVKKLASNLLNILATRKG